MTAITSPRGDQAVPDGWRWVRLGDHLAVCRNGLVSRQDANPDEAVPITRIETIAVGKIDWTRVGYVPLEDADPGYFVQQGDILLSHINSVKHIGKVARMAGGGPLLHGMNLMLLRFSDSLDSGFGYALMSSASTKLYMERRAKKAVNQASINRQDIFELPILLPPLPEQRAIAAVLDSVDDAIEGTEAVIAATEGLRDALLHDLLTRGLPGQHTEFRDVPGLGTIPADWEVVRLGDVLESTTYGTNSPLSAEGEMPVLRMSNLQGGQIDLIDVRRASLSEKETRELDLNDGDILFNRTNSLDLVGKVAVVRNLPKPMSFASYLVRLRVKEERANPFWLSALLWSGDCQSRIRKFATPGVSQANINPTALKTLAIPLPPLAEQQPSAATLDGVDAAIEVAREERGRLRLLKESTADVLLTGRVRVKVK